MSAGGPGPPAGCRDSHPNPKVSPSSLETVRVFLDPQSCYRPSPWGPLEGRPGVDRQAPGAGGPLCPSHLPAGRGCSLSE